MTITKRVSIENTSIARLFDKDIQEDGTLVWKAIINQIFERQRVGAKNTSFLTDELSEVSINRLKSKGYQVWSYYDYHEQINTTDVLW